MVRDKKWGELIVSSLFISMRILFGLGWLLAGVTKITGKSWYSEPGVFLTKYLHDCLSKENVPDFYKYFIEAFALEHVMFLNGAIPMVQILLGVCILVGFLTLPAVGVCLFMHINFILSGNMNVTSLILYTSAFSLFLGRKSVYLVSLDRYLGIEQRFTRASL